MLGTFVFYSNAYKKAFGDWAYSAPPYLAGLKSGRKGQGRGGREETKGVIRDRIHHLPPTIPGSATDSPHEIAISIGLFVHPVDCTVYRMSILRAVYRCIGNWVLYVYEARNWLAAVRCY